MRSAGKAKPDQNHILGNQLKRVVKKVNSIKAAKAPPIIDAATGKVIGSTANSALSTASKAAPSAAKLFGSTAVKTLGRAAPFAGAAISGGLALNNLRQGNYLSAGLNTLGGAASFIPGLGIPLSIGAGLAADYFEKTPTTSGLSSSDVVAPVSSASENSMSSNMTGMPFGLNFPGGFTAPQPQPRWDAGLSPSERFSVMNQSMGKAGSALQKPEYPDIRQFMKNPPAAGEYIPSPIPILQAGFKQHEFAQPTSRQQGYGPIGNFLRQLIFNVGLPAIGVRNPLYPDFSKVYGSLVNNEAYKFVPPNSF